MAYDHLCGEFYSGNMQLLPPRIKRANPDALEDRWVTYNYSMDLTPEPGDDEFGNAYGAWAIWDLPVATAAQIDDDRGDDFVTVSINDRIYVLDYERFSDEYNWDVRTSIYRLLKLGPIPASSEPGDGAGGYDPFTVKRFRELTFRLTQEPADLDGSRYRISVEEFDNEGKLRQGVRETAQRNLAKVALMAADFAVTIEHCADEQFSLRSWQAKWDDVKRPFKNSPVLREEDQ